MYTPEDAGKWNAFAAKAKNATFLFDRGFMDYHADRFLDCSLIAEGAGQWRAILPANRHGDTVYSHEGLTYGGLVFDELKLAEVLRVFQAVLRFLEARGAAKLVVKNLPLLYQRQPSQELDYALFLTRAKLLRRDTLAVLDLSAPYRFSTNRKRQIKKAVDEGLEVIETPDLTDFWTEILMPNLQKKHAVKPVHSLAEITLLKFRFPQFIRQFNVYRSGILLAGTTIFDTGTAVHCQYIAAKEGKSEAGALDFLYQNLIRDVFSHYRWFDFGSSNEAGGKKLNAGLSFWKQTFGAGVMTQDFYEVDTAAHSLLNDILL